MENQEAAINAGYEFRSEPRPVQITSRSKKYRDPINHAIAFDTRVRQTLGRTIFDLKPPKKTRVDVDLTPHLIEQVESAESKDVSMQTDVFKNRPRTPPFVPPKRGVDASTQIEASDIRKGLIFDFDRDVDPILEILSGKTLEQALVEVESEEEIKVIRKRRAVLEASKEEEVQRAKRLERLEQEIWRKKQIKMQQERERLKRERTITNKMRAIATSRNVVRDAMSLFNDWFKREHDANVTSDVAENFMPWLTESVARSAEIRETVIAATTDQLILDSLTRGYEKFRQHKCWIRVVVKRESSETEDLLGPIPVLRNDSVEIVLNKLRKWVEQHDDNPSAGSDLSLWYGGIELRSHEKLLMIAKDLGLLEVKERS